MRNSELEPGALWWRYLTALALVATFLIVSHAASLSALSGGEEASTAINVSGRQRMLSQRILALTQREQAEAGSDPALTEALDQSIDLFARSHLALIQGGDLGLTAEGAAKRQEIYFSTGTSMPLNNRVEAFLEDLQVARGPAGPERTEALAHLSDLTETDKLLMALDDAVHAIEDQAAAGVVTFRKISWLALGGAFLVLFLEACLIFWPAQRAVNASYVALKTKRDDLAKSESSLKRALASSDQARQTMNRMLSARTAFFGQMSRDLHTPISVLRGYVDQLMGEDFPEKVKRRLRLVQGAAEQMEAIINDVLDLRKIEEGLMAIEEAPLRVEDFVNGVLVRYGTRASRKGLILKADIAENVPRWILGDPTRIDQVLDNLVSNAVKYSFKGAVTVRVQRSAIAQWTLEVEDEGEGMTPEQLDALFGRFEQVPGEPGRCEGGTGLGLPICHDLAKLMGGELTVESQAGEGSTFKMTLPLKVADAPKDEDTEEQLAVVAA